MVLKDWHTRRYRVFIELYIHSEEGQIEMKYTDEKDKNIKLPSPDTELNSLRADCGSCFGLCCVALYFSASDGFPVDKEAGIPCLNLQADFSCSAHKNLRRMGYIGCTAYDCFGAGQKVAQITYGGNSWWQVPESAKQMFEVFLIMRQLQEMLWYLTEAYEFQIDSSIKDEIKFKINETELLTRLSADSLLELDVAAHRVSVNALLLQASELVRTGIYCKRDTKARHKSIRSLDFIGADLRKKELKGENLNGAYLIAADLRGTDLTGTVLIGVDLRDADLRGTDLTNSIFLTQAQINSAKGDSNTKLPKSINRPEHW